MCERLIVQAGAVVTLFVLAARTSGAEPPPAQPEGAAPATQSPEVAPPPEPAHEPAPAPDLPESGDKLQITLAPYLWLTSLNGTTGIKGIDTNIDLTFGDIVRDSSKLYALFGALDLQYGKFVFNFNGAYAHVEVDSSGATERFPAIRIGQDLTFDTSWFEFTGGYRFIDVPVDDTPDSKRRFRLDGLAGARLTVIEVDAKVNASATVTLPDGTVLTPSVKRGLSQTEEWVEPYIGARAAYDITDTFTVGLRGDVGGFGAGSEFAWQAIFALGWKFPLGSANGSLILGYRALGQNYENGGFKWDMTVYGPVLGFAVSF